MKLKEFYRQTVRTLQESGIENARFESRQLLTGLFSLKETDLLSDRIEITPQQQATVENCCRKRCNGYPLQYLLGEWEFYGLPFDVGEGVLIPRQDTETLCEWVLQSCSKHQPERIIDLCSGSGCIAVTLAKYLPKSRVFALEKSEKAAEYCRRNIEKNRVSVTLLQDDAISPSTLETGFDLIVSNPPYISSKDREKLQKELSYEPEEALFAEEEGLFFYRKLTEVWKERLKPGGGLIYEVGIHQHQAVCDILKGYGFESVGTQKDLCGIDRIVFGKRPD